MRLLWFVEYFQEGSGIPVNLSIGLQSHRQAYQHGREVTQDNGYCGFWICSKPVGTIGEADRVEYHSVSYSPDGRAVWKLPLRADMVAG